MAKEDIGDTMAHDATFDLHLHRSVIWAILLVLGSWDFDDQRVAPIKDKEWLTWTKKDLCSRTK